MNRKDFLKLLAAAPLVGLAKFMPVEKGGTLKENTETLFFHAGGKPELITSIANRPGSYPLYEDTDMTMMVNRFGVSVDFQVGDIVDISETVSGYHATYKIKSIDGDGAWDVVIVSGDEI